MRIIIMGSGGVGGYFGAKFAAAGHEVGFIARGSHLEAMQGRGLRVRSPLGDIDLPHVWAGSDPATFGIADIVLVCVKLWDTESAAQMLRPAVGPGTMVLSVQNGVQKDEVLGRVLGEQALAGGICYVAARITEPGVIQHVGQLKKLVFGEYKLPASDRTRTFLDACQQSDVDAELSPDIRRAVWEKFVLLVGLSAVTTAMRQPIGVIRAHSEARRLLLALMQEVVAVGRAHEVALDADFAQDRLRFCDGLPAEMTTSMHTDLENGRRLELEWLSGGVSVLGRSVGVATPLNDTVNSILAVHAQGNPITL